MAINNLWLFNIQSHNWRECLEGPPELDVHGEHVGNPWHGLNSNTKYQADRMKQGELAIVRQSGTGVMGIWEIEETASVTSQSHHEWQETYEKFIYCTPLVRKFDEPIDDMEFLHHHDFARFNAGANALSEEFRVKYLENILEMASLEESTRAALESELRLEEVEEPTATSHKGSETSSVSAKPATSDTSGTRRSYTRDTVVVSDAFRDRMLALYENSCLLTNLSGSPFVTLAHVEDRSNDKEIAEHPNNVLILNWLHHKAFDAGIFTFDSDLRLRVDPTFSTESEFLKETLVRRDGEKIEFPNQTTLDSEFLKRRNKRLDWM